MTPTNFPQANARFGPPETYDESQIATIYAHNRVIQGGTLDGDTQVIVAWKPSAAEAMEIFQGKPIYLSMIGGLAPHCLTTSFEDAIRSSGNEP